jgi:hypothetical protein
VSARAEGYRKDEESVEVEILDSAGEVIHDGGRRRTQGGLPGITPKPSIPHNPFGAYGACRSFGTARYVQGTGPTRGNGVEQPVRFMRILDVGNFLEKKCVSSHGDRGETSRQPTRRIKRPRLSEAVVTFETADPLLKSRRKHRVKRTRERCYSPSQRYRHPKSGLAFGETELAIA